MPKIAFRPVWLTTQAEAMSSDDIGAYISWLQSSMRAMPEVDRNRARKIKRRLMAEQKARRSRARALTGALASEERS